MELRLLGPVEVWDGGTRLPLHGAKPTAILAALAVHLGEVLSAGRLVDLVWEERPPATARALVASHVSGLRRALGAAGEGPAITTRSPGYLVTSPPWSVDARLFEEALGRGRRLAGEGRAAEAAQLLRETVNLWRGREALEGLGQTFARNEAARLAELRLDAHEVRFAAEMSLGCRDGLVAELYAQVAANPLRERLRGLLMTALFRTGRLPDALRAYQEGRSLLRDQLGIEPGPELRGLHQALLREDTAVLGAPSPTGPPHARTGGGPGQPPAAAAPAAGDPGARAARPVPSHVPPDVADFVGRTDEIAWATALLHGSGDPRRTAPPVGLISGRPGVGKTTLAVHIGHRVAPLFPDGRLFLDLRASGSTPLATPDALARLLRALGAVPDELPTDQEELLGLYRTHIARRRVLLILDNAVDESRLRPLLPPGGGSAVLVTSRRRLVALEGAAHLELTAPPDGEALDLLARVIGPGRVAAEPAAASEIVTLCGRLPLAVRIAGARLAARPHWTPARLAARLRDERRRLDELRAGDLEVRASLALGYADLGEQERRALRRLALMDLPDFASWIAAPLLDITVDEAEEAVEALVDRHFAGVVGTDGTGRSRYRVHALAREYARERCLAEESAQDREAAVLRLADRWLAMAAIAASRGPGGASGLPPGPHDGGLADEAVRELMAGPAGPGGPGAEAATWFAAWFAAEQPCLVAAVTHCAENGLTRTARELAAVVGAGSAALYNQFDAWTRSHTVALDAVRRRGDTAEEAWLLNGLGRLRLEQDRFEEAYRHFADALALFERTGAVRGRADALAGMGTARREQGRFDEALELLTAALAGYRDLGDGAGTARQHYGIGCVHRDRGHYTEARAEIARAQGLFEEAGDRHGRALALRALALWHRARGELGRAEELSRAALGDFEATADSFGTMYAGQALAKVLLRRGRPAEARERLDRCLEVTRERQDTFGEALVVRTLGEWYLAAGDRERAARELRRALDLWDVLRLPLWRARTLRDLATALAGGGGPERAEARAAWEEALRVFDEYGSREAGELRAAGFPAAASRAGDPSG
ncbi:BTAD domain-containing putative transcriptional regulator [Streptomyces sp. NPDC015131]|uniref:AfsR/SARP family transcriptional regulator n=1 Tax=Streptomyces sp. NPDC015131 TaxID=3364941 RepID=UPI0036FCF55F